MALTISIVYALCLGGTVFARHLSQSDATELHPENALISGVSSPAINQKPCSMHQCGENIRPGFLDLRNRYVPFEAVELYNWNGTDLKVAHGGCEMACKTGWYLTDDCPGESAVYVDECTRELGNGQSCCSISQLTIDPPSQSEDCCDEGFNLIPSEECSGSRAIYIDECTRQNPGTVCCGESSISAESGGEAGNSPTGEACCDEGFELVESDQACPGEKAIALTECAKEQSKVCCSK